MVEQADEPIYLTAAGRRRLEQRRAEYEAQIARLTPGTEAEPDARDQADDAEQLIEADDLAPIQDRLAEAQDVLRRARPMPEGPDDGVIRLGSVVRVRDDAGEESRLTLVQDAEYDGGDEHVSLSSPVGRALFGQAAGSQFTVNTPAGRRTLTILSVAPYREHTS